MDWRLTCLHARRHAAGAQPPEAFQEAVQMALKEAGSSAGGGSSGEGGACTGEGCT